MQYDLKYKEHCFDIEIAASRNNFRKYSFTRGNGFLYGCVKAFYNCAFRQSEQQMTGIGRLLYDNKSSGHGFSTRYGNSAFAPPLFIGGKHERRIL